MLNIELESGFLKEAKDDLPAKTIRRSVVVPTLLCQPVCNVPNHINTCRTGNNTGEKVRLLGPLKHILTVTINGASRRTQKILAITLFMKMAAMHFLLKQCRSLSITIIHNTWWAFVDWAFRCPFAESIGVNSNTFVSVAAPVDLGQSSFVNVHLFADHALLLYRRVISIAGQTAVYALQFGRALYNPLSDALELCYSYRPKGTYVFIFLQRARIMLLLLR